MVRSIYDSDAELNDEFAGVTFLTVAKKKLHRVE
jgi:hypothetical protein